MIQQVSRLANHTKEGDLKQWLKQLPPPWPTFREDVLRAREAVVVSHKQDHNPLGRLHEMTAYGVTYMDHDAFARKDAHVVLNTAISIENLTQETAKMICDVSMRDALCTLLQKTPKKEWAIALQRWGQAHNVRRLKTLRLLGDPTTYFPVRDRITGQVYKVYEGGENVCMEIYRLPDGSWGHEVISRKNAANPQYQTNRQRQGYPLLMRLYKNDPIALNEGGQRTIYIVASIAAKGQVDLKEHNDASKQLFSPRIGGLQKRGARKIHVSILGYVKDPGPRR